MSKKRSVPDETTPPKTRDELMDSLPYIDVPNEDYEQYALALIEAEMKELPPPSLPDLPPVKFRTPILEAEYQRYLDNNGQPEPRVLSLPTASPPSNGSSNKSDWKTAVQTARTEYEMERLRSITLEVKKDAGAALLWKGYNGNLDQELQSVQSVLQRQRQLVERINFQRSQDQEKSGKELQVLTHQYQEALHRRVQLQQATIALEQEVSPSS